MFKLSRKNPIRNVVGRYKMSFVVYFELVLGFGWKFRVKRGKPAISIEIAGEYRYSNSFLVLRILSTSTKSRVSVLKAIFCPEDVEYRY